MSSQRVRHTWNPRKVLEIADDGRCVGITSRKNKCCFGIAGSNLASANRDIVIISASAPDSVVLQQKLSALADKLVCKRYHRGEGERAALVSSIVELWGARIDVFAAKEAEKRRKKREEAQSRQMDALLVNLLGRVSIGHLVTSPVSGVHGNPPAYTSSASSGECYSISPTTSSSSRSSSDSSTSDSTESSGGSYTPSSSSSSDTVMAGTDSASE